MYKHLDLEERVKISVYLMEGYNPSQIARKLGRDRSTINREIKRGITFKGDYFAQSSHEKAKKRWKENHKAERIPDKKIREYIITCLVDKRWSPEEISARMKLELGKSVSYETIYMWIYCEKSELTKYLTRKHSGRKKRNYLRKSKKTHIPNRIAIETRPVEANKRQEFGHFEADTIVSKQSKSALLVIADRLTRMVKIKKLARKTAEQASNAIIFALKNFNTVNLSTITYDNGSEFCYHEKVNQELKIKSFFCNPYHSWEKGTVENINGLIRRFFPKGTDFDTITDEQIQYVENWINNRPMKVLDWKTPLEKFQELNLVALTS